MVYALDIKFYRDMIKIHQCIRQLCVHFTSLCTVRSIMNVTARVPERDRSGA